jgi:hypothetical protein
MDSSGDEKIRRERLAIMKDDSSIHTRKTIAATLPARSSRKHDYARSASYETRSAPG